MQLYKQLLSTIKQGWQCRYNCNLLVRKWSLECESSVSTSTTRRRKWRRKLLSWNPSSSPSSNAHKRHGVLATILVILLMIQLSHLMTVNRLHGATEQQQQQQQQEYLSRHPLAQQQQQAQDWMTQRNNENDTSTSSTSTSTSGHLQCIAWRATGECRPDGPRIGALTNNHMNFWERLWRRLSSWSWTHEYAYSGTDLSCDQRVPWLGSGYCELLDTSTNTLVKVYQKSCTESVWHGLRYLRRFDVTQLQQWWNAAPQESVFPHFTCHQAVAFWEYKHRMLTYEPPHFPDLQHYDGVEVAVETELEVVTKTTQEDDNATTTQTDTTTTTTTTTPPITTTITRGIVMQVYPGAMASVYAIIHLLRDVHGCHLPIELWSLPSEGITYQHEIIRQLVSEYSSGDTNNNNILLRFIPLASQDDSFTTQQQPSQQQQQPVFNNNNKYMSKPYSIVYSQFDQVLFLDSDNFPLRDPTFLFETSQFEQMGAIFWKDFWRPSHNDFFLTQSSVVWELLGIDNTTSSSSNDNDHVHFRHEMEMESGQMVVDRRRFSKAFKVLLFLATTFDEFLGPLDLVLGDKDLFRLAFYVTQTPYHYVEQPPSIAGYDYFGDICGVTMIQPDPISGQPLFFHRNAVKIADDDVASYVVASSSLRGSQEGNNNDDNNNNKNVDSTMVQSNRIWQRGMIYQGTTTTTTSNNNNNNDQQQLSSNNNHYNNYGIGMDTRILWWTKAFRITCFFPKDASHFQNVDYRDGSDIEALETKILSFAQTAMRILHHQKSNIDSTNTNDKSSIE